MKHELVLFLFVSRWKVIGSETKFEPQSKLTTSRIYYIFRDRMVGLRFHVQLREYIIDSDWAKLWTKLKSSYATMDRATLLAQLCLCIAQLGLRNCASATAVLGCCNLFCGCLKQDCTDRATSSVVLRQLLSHALTFSSWFCIFSGICFC